MIPPYTARQTEKDVSGAPRARGCNAQPRDTARNHARLHPGNPNALTHTRHTPQSTHAYVIIDCGAHAASQLGAGARPQPRPTGTHPSDTPAEGKGRPEASSPPGPKAHGAPRRRTPSAGLPVSHGGGGGSATRGGAVSSCVSSIGGRVSLREFLLRRMGAVRRRRSGGRLRRGFGRGAGLSHRREFRRSSAG